MQENKCKNYFENSYTKEEILSPTDNKGDEETGSPNDSYLESHNLSRDSRGRFISLKGNNLYNINNKDNKDRRTNKDYYKYCKIPRRNYFPYYIDYNEFKECCNLYYNVFDKYNYPILRHKECEYCNYLYNVIYNNNYNDCEYCNRHLKSSLKR